jgi:phage-related protein
MKELEFVGTSLDELKKFPDEARRRAGWELDTLQRGGTPTDFKPMPAVGAGVYELRVHAAGEWRVMYTAKFKNVVYVLHAFSKKTQKVRVEDIELAAKRYRQVRAENE